IPLTPTYSLRSEVAAPGFSAAGQLRYAYSVERVAAVFVLIALSPVLLVLGIAIAVLSRSGPLVRHARVGWNGRPLYMLKFRTMWERGNGAGRFRMVE